MSYDEVNHIQNVFRTFPVRLSIPTHELGDVKPSQRRTKKLSPITASVSLCIGHDFLLRGSAAPCSDELDVLDVLPPRGELAEIGCQISVEGQSLNSREVEAVSNLIRQDTAWLGVLGVDWNAEKDAIIPRNPLILHPRPVRSLSEMTDSTRPHPSIVPPVFWTLCSIQIHVSIGDDRSEKSRYDPIQTPSQALVSGIVDAICRGLRSRTPLCFSEEAKKDFPTAAFALDSLSRTLEDVLSHPPVGQNCDIESAACEGMRKDLLQMLSFIRQPSPNSLLFRPHCVIAWRLRTLATQQRFRRETKLCKMRWRTKNVVLPDATVVPNASPSFDTVTFALPTSWRQSQVNASTEVGSSYMVEASDYIKKDDDWEDLAFLMDSASDEDDLAFLVDSASDEDDLDFLVDSDDDDLASLMNSALSI